MALYYQGHETCSCAKKWLIWLFRVLAIAGIRGRVTQIIGNYGPSGGTHTGGGVIDIILDNPRQYPRLIKICRLAGADASWHRPKGWDGPGSIEHAHIVLRGCPHRSPAAVRQYTGPNGVLNGGNGLARWHNDDGYRPLSGRHWDEGIRWMQRWIKTKQQAAKAGKRAS